MNRQRLYGTNFGWYMWDRNGLIALFLSGYGPIPYCVFKEEENFQKTDSLFKEFPRISNTYLSPEIEEEVIIREKDLLYDGVMAASKGFYAYDNEEYTDLYKLVAVPKIPLKITQLGSEVQDVLRPFRFKDIEFDKIRSLNMRDHFECD